jgi:hypothetical protein
MDDQLLRLMAHMDSHFDAADVSPADRDDWKALKRQILRMQDALGLASIELESDVRPSEERARMALQHVRFGLGK